MTDAEAGLLEIAMNELTRLGRETKDKEASGIIGEIEDYLAIRAGKPMADARVLLKEVEMMLRTLQNEFWWDKLEADLLKRIDAYLAAEQQGDDEFGPVDLTDVEPDDIQNTWATQPEPKRVVAGYYKKEITHIAGGIPAVKTTDIRLDGHHDLPLTVVGQLTEGGENNGD